MRGAERVSSLHIHPFSAVFDGANLIWSDWTRRFILWTPISSPYQIKLLRQFSLTPYGIALYNSRNVGGTNGCAENNGGCSQLCLPEPSGSHVCACCRGVLQSDNRTCLIDHKKSFPYFLVADYNSARGLDVETLADVHPPLRGLQLAVAIDYDPVRETIYYTDTYTDEVHATYRNGTTETLAHGFIHPAGVAVDWIGCYVYFTDTILNVVGFAKMNTSELVILIRDNMTNPRDIALDLTRGKMYWTDYYNSSGRIERADMDGRNREVIVNDLEQPSGLALDIENEVIYWVDKKSLKIEKSNFDGTNRAIVASSLSDPFHLVFHKGSLYWTDWNEKNIVRMQVNASGVPISNPTTYATPSPPLRIPSGIALYDPPSRLQIRENLTERYPPYCADSCAEEPRKANASCNESDCCFCPPYCVPVTKDGKLSRNCFCTKNNAHLCHPMPTASIERWDESSGIITLMCKVATGVDVNIPTLYTRWLKGHSSIAFTWWLGGTTTGTCHYHRLEIPIGEKGNGIYSCGATNRFGTTVSNEITIGSENLAEDDNDSDNDSIG
ncbi:low-density lipoprotein receptor-related protein 4-like [Oscarella lobularis]|uniref:low-density lipoprotein receptor-related protein 4-like n=1 Tax=Oscarella lobularis TaxID=121494 RepID=UPI003313F8DA